MERVSDSDNDFVDRIILAAYKTLHENDDSVVTSLSVVNKAV